MERSCNSLLPIIAPILTISRSAYLTLSPLPGRAMTYTCQRLRGRSCRRLRGRAFWTRWRLIAPCRIPSRWSRKCRRRPCGTKLRHHAMNLWNGMFRNINARTKSRDVQEEVGWSQRELFLEEEIQVEVMNRLLCYPTRNINPFL